VQRKPEIAEQDSFDLGAMLLGRTEINAGNFAEDGDSPAKGAKILLCDLKTSASSAQKTEVKSARGAPFGLRPAHRNPLRRSSSEYAHDDSDRSKAIDSSKEEMPCHRQSSKPKTGLT
jgi:hypothetical protein